VENLRYMLSGFNTSDPLNFGLHLKGNVKNSYMNGGADYVLSREALKWFVEGALYDESKCLQDDFGPENLELGEFQV
jgi:glycoprotein-N-acetylgalactosamine 3-beta-galactosyltransferase